MKMTRHLPKHAHFHVYIRLIMDLLGHFAPGYFAAKGLSGEMTSGQIFSGELSGQGNFIVVRHYTRRYLYWIGAPIDIGTIPLFTMINTNPVPCLCDQRALVIKSAQERPKIVASLLALKICTMEA